MLFVVFNDSALLYRGLATTPFSPPLQSDEVIHPHVHMQADLCD